MKAREIRVLLSSVVLSLGFYFSSSAGEVFITVYPKGLCVVRELRSVTVEKGVNEIAFDDVADAIEPGSVLIEPKGGSRLRILENRYESATANSGRLFESHIGKDIEIFTKGEKLLTGRLLSMDAMGVLLGVGQGAVFLNRDNILEVKFPGLPSPFLLKQTLFVTVESDKTSKQELELSYLAGGLGWHGEYSGKLDKSERKLLLSGFASIENGTGVGFEDARLKLVAGDVKRAQEVEIRRRFGTGARQVAYSESGMMEPEFQEESVFEYHTYRLGRSVSLKEGETKLLSLFEPESVAVKKVFRYDGSRYGKRVAINFEFLNNEKEGLGIPIPAGKVKLYKQSADGLSEFLGEDILPHTSKDEKVTIFPGFAFDIAGERAVKSASRITDRIREESVEIVLRNHKEEDVEVLVVEHLSGEWEITKKTHEYVKKEASTIEFPVVIPKDDTVIVSYTVRIKS